VQALSELMWDGQVIWPDIERWLANFNGPDGDSERLHALHLLSQFSFFNSRLMRSLLRASPRLFVHPHELYDSRAAGTQLASVLGRVVFLDDFCGSGRQVRRYTRNIIPKIRQENEAIRLCYYPLFATSEGLERVRQSKVFDEVETLCELDGSFRAVSPESRYFLQVPAEVSREFAEQMCVRYGQLIEPSAPLGFRDCQLLIGFAHNIPNNTLPIFWSEGTEHHQWTPVFPRYKKGGQW
jgi:hypothetical protein